MIDNSFDHLSQKNISPNFFNPFSNHYNYTTLSLKNKFKVLDCISLLKTIHQIKWKSVCNFWWQSYQISISSCCKVCFPRPRMNWSDTFFSPHLSRVFLYAEIPKNAFHMSLPHFHNTYLTGQTVIITRVWTVLKGNGLRKIFAVTFKGRLLKHPGYLFIRSHMELLLQKKIATKER